MLPAFKPHQKVIVSPNVRCQTGNRGLVKLKDERVLIAEMRFNGDEVTLIKYNDENIKAARKDIVFCHKIVWVKEI